MNHIWNVCILISAPGCGVKFLMASLY